MLEIQQSRHSNRVGFVFKEDELPYSATDSSGSRSFPAPYTEISRDRKTREERSQWFRNVGLFWTAIGALSTVSAWLGRHEIVQLFWLFLVAAYYAAYRFCTHQVHDPADRAGIR